MTDRSEADLSYRDELRRWVPALVGLQPVDGVGDALAPGCPPAGLKLFAQSNLSKRRQKLQGQLEVVAEAFEDFEDLVSAYARTVPAPADDAADGEGFLSWLERTGEPMPRQRDYVACQRARLAVEAAARADRHGHLRFQELRRTASELADEWDTDPGLRVWLNPIRAWSRFLTPALLDDDAAVPADVLFFAAGDAIRTAVLEPHGRALVEELAAHTPCTLDEWAALSRHADREELAALGRDLAEMGLVAFGRFDGRLISSGVGGGPS